MSNSTRIFKNTLILYGRMVVMMLIALYTSRILLKVLGFENFGVYNVVAGIIIFFTFLNNGLGTGTRRYITAEVGKINDSNLQHVFNICFQSHLIIAGIVLITGEIIGVWVVNNILNIPSEKMFGANIAFQCSLFIAILGIIQSSYSTVITAYERMNVYAYFTIFDVVAKLGFIFAIEYIKGDKLIIYSLLLSAISLISFSINFSYCYKKFPRCRLKKVTDKKLLKDIFKFMSWNLLGQIAVVLTNQGVSILVNLFYNVIVNAAMGISNQVTSIVSNFVSNFQVAFNPQIIKQYHNDQHEQLKHLINRSSKISSYLIIIFLIPICLEIQKVLTLWLSDYPQYTPQFVVFTLISMYFSSISAPLWMVVYAQSNIQKYQIVISLVYSMNFFISWGLLAFGMAPYIVILVRIVVLTWLILVRLKYVKLLLPDFNIKFWLSDILFKGIAITLFTIFSLKFIVDYIDCSLFSHIVITTILSLSVSISLIYFWGFDRHERLFVKQIMLHKLFKHKSNHSAK